MLVINAIIGFSVITANPSAQSRTADTVSDVSGNLVFDNDYFYQYDAWGRLAQVNRMLGMTAADFDGEGRLLGSAQSHVGDLVAHYTYDGLGRLIIKTVLTAPGSSTKQYQHHYYDGVRRVQEQFYTEDSGGGGSGGGDGTACRIRLFTGDAFHCSDGTH